LITDLAPIIERVGTWGIMNLVCQRIASSKARLVARLYLHCRPLAGRGAFALANGDDGVVAIRIDIETVISRLRNRERQVRRIDLVDLAAVEMAHMHIQRALMQ
jgi:hypothetical protein